MSKTSRTKTAPKVADGRGTWTVSLDLSIMQLLQVCKYQTVQYA